MSPSLHPQLTASASPIVHVQGPSDLRGARGRAGRWAEGGRLARRPTPHLRDPPAHQDLRHPQGGAEGRRDGRPGLRRPAPRRRRRPVPRRQRRHPAQGDCRDGHQPPRREPARGVPDGGQVRAVRRRAARAPLPRGEGGADGALRACAADAGVRRPARGGRLAEQRGQRRGPARPGPGPSGARASPRPPAPRASPSPVVCRHLH